MDFYHHDAVVERSRKQVMCHMMKNNIGIIRKTTLDVKNVRDFQGVAFCSGTMITMTEYSLKQKQRTLIFLFAFIQKKHSKTAFRS